jgi:hypothetical protein
MNRSNEKLIQNILTLKNLKEGERLVEVDIDGRIILKRFLMKVSRMM